jgi:hypothetical protein
VIFGYRVLSYRVFLGLSSAILYNRFNRLNRFLENFKVSKSAFSLFKLILQAVLKVLN